MAMRAGVLATVGAVLAALAFSDVSSAQSPPKQPAPPPTPLEQRLGEAWRWRTIDGPDGQSTVFRIVRPGRDGGLLALDDEGLASYDGWNWDRRAGWSALTDQDIRDVVPLQDGLLLVCANSVVTVNAHGALNTVGPGSTPASVSRACHHEDGLIDIACNGQIERASIERLEPLLDPPPDAGLITAIAHQRDGSMWCAAEKGFFRQEGEGWRLMSPMPEAHVRRIWYPFALTAGDRILFLPERIDSLIPCVAWDGEKVEFMRPPGPSITPSDATTTHEEAIIVASRSPELLVWREGQWHSVRIPSLSGLDNAVSLASLSEDRLAVVFDSGRLAICELGSRQWETWDTRRAGAGGNVNAIAPSRHGGIWLGTDDGVLRLHDGQFVEKHLMADDQPLHDITGLAEADDGALWVGSGASFRGAWRLQQGRWEQRADEDSLGHGYVHKIRKLGDELWFAFIGGVFDGWDNGGFVRLKDGQLTPFLLDDKGQRLSRSYDVVRRSDGTLLAGVRAALKVLDGEVWRDAPDSHLFNRTVFALHEASDGALWVGYGLHSPGAAVLRDGDWDLLSKDTWHRAAAGSFAETPDGRLWFASEKGLFLVTSTGCHEVSGLLPFGKFWPVLPDPDGGLWLGSTGVGLLHFNMEDDNPPQVRDVTIRFSELGDAIASWTAVDRWNSTPPEELSFRLRLDGKVMRPGASGVMQRTLDPQDTVEALLQPGGPSQDPDDHRLEPGEHTLHIAALDNLGNDLGDTFKYVFSVPPPAWRSWWVLLEASATVIVLVCLLVVLRNRRRERAAAAASQRALADRLSHLSLRLLSSQEDERRSISREMHDDLGQLLTAACLDIERASRLEDVDRRQEALRTALRAARDTQRRVREISHMLRPSELDDHGLPQAVATVLSDFTSRSGIDIDSRVDLEVDRVPADVANNVFRILQEALTNILRHARATTAYVTLRATEGSVELTVRDDGAGFAPESLTSAQHYGLLGMRERSELLGGKFSISSRPGGGTEVFVSIPIPHR